MKKVFVVPLTLLLMLSMFSVGCDPPSNCPSDWRCVPYSTCLTGDTWEQCYNPSYTSGGFRVGNRCFQCAYFSRERQDCASAASAAVRACGGLNKTFQDFDDDEIFEFWEYIFEDCQTP